MLNVKEVSEKASLGNEEIQSLVKILGLQFGRCYEDTSSLRYGHLLVMADQDYDGSHIKGLVLNLFATYWPSLLRIGFLQQFITPIVRVSRGNEQHVFFTMKEFHDWEMQHRGESWRVKWVLRAFPLQILQGTGHVDGEGGKRVFFGAGNARGAIQTDHRGRGRLAGHVFPSASLRGTQRVDERMVSGTNHRLLLASLSWYYG